MVREKQEDTLMNIKKFSSDMQKALVQKRIDAATLAEKTSVSEATVSKWVRGESFPRAHRWGLLLSLLGIDARNYFVDKQSQNEIPAPVQQPPNQENNDQPTDIIDMVQAVIESQTVYRGALLSIIKSLYKAVAGEIDMEHMREKLERLEQDNYEIKEMLRSLGATLSGKKREAV